MAQRNTTRRDRHRQLIARDKPPCHLCGREILWNADHLHPLAFQADHITPLSRGGEDVLENLAASHRVCNQSRYNKPLPGQKPGVTFITHRTW